MHFVRNFIIFSLKCLYNLTMILTQGCACIVFVLINHTNRSTRPHDWKSIRKTTWSISSHFKLSKHKKQPQKRQKGCILFQNGKNKIDQTPLIISNLSQTFPIPYSTFILVSVWAELGPAQPQLVYFLGTFQANVKNNLRLVGEKLRNKIRNI